MKKVCFSLIFALFVLSAAIGIKAQSPASAFAGTWILDKAKTNTTKDFPDKLRNYGMVVTDQNDKLSVKSRIDGNVEIQAAGNGERVPVTESASMMGSNRAAGSSSSSGGKINYGGTMALFFTVNDATYNLDGEEVKIETKQGLIRVKAKPDKTGKILQFTTIRRMKMTSGEVEVYIRESWKLAEDGKSLKLQRTVETPNARDEIVMILAKAD